MHSPRPYSSDDLQQFAMWLQSQKYLLKIWSLGSQTNQHPQKQDYLQILKNDNHNKKSRDHKKSYLA